LDFLPFNGEKNSFQPHKEKKMKSLIAIVFTVVVVLTTHSYGQGQNNTVNGSIVKKINNYFCFCVTAENCSCYASDDPTKKTVFTFNFARSDYQFPKGIKLGKVTKTKSHNITPVLLPNGYEITIKSKGPVTTGSKSKDAKNDAVIGLINDAKKIVAGFLEDFFGLGGGTPPASQDCQQNTVLVFNIDGTLIMGGDLKLEVNCKNK
jgi:hypothetical protein